MVVCVVELAMRGRKGLSVEYMREVRDYMVQHGSMPVESASSAGYLLAKRIRAQRDRGTFNRVELAELNSMRRKKRASAAEPRKKRAAAAVPRRCKVQVLSSSSARGLAATSTPATGQAAHASHTLPTNAGRVPVVAIGKVIMLCAKAVRNAGLLGVEEVGNTGEQLEWSAVPKECGFKIERPGGRGHQHRATKEEKTAQCLEYRRYKKWALKCGLAEEELKEYLRKADDLPRNMLGIGDVPAPLRQYFHGTYRKHAWHGKNGMTRREHHVLLCRQHAVLLCCVAALRQHAVLLLGIGGLGGREEME